MNFEDFKLERYFAKHEFTARHLISCSDSESMELGQLLNFEPGSREKLEKLWLGYSDSQGIPELRSEISKLYQKISPDQILCHTGAQEPILNLLSTVLGPGDHMITHFPCYQSNYSVPRGVGASVSFWSTHPETGWKLDPNELKKLIQPNTKIVVVNFPHNPTGYIPSLSEYKEFISILRERGILLLSDEIYRGLEMNEEDRLPAGADLYENAISLSGLAKVYGLAGLRMGWVATRNEKVLSLLKKQKDYTTICNPIITEWLAALALRHGSKIIQRNCDIVKSNIEVFENFLSRHSELFSWVRPKGGTMGFAYRRDRQSLEPFCEHLLKQEGLMLISGKYFDTGENFFRLGLGRKNFPEVLTLFERNLSKLTN